MGQADPDFWKKRYSQTWPGASARVAEVAQRIHQETGLNAIPVGLGAASAEFLPGDAASRGYEKGAADLSIEGTNAFIEVTGPLVRSVRPADPLWIRPDKLEHAHKHKDEHRTWIVHCLADGVTWRVIPLSKDFYLSLERGDFPLERKNIRGTDEAYHVVPAAHPCVRQWDALVDWLRQL
jgi:hypothetical protein